MTDGLFQPRRRIDPQAAPAAQAPPAYFFTNERPRAFLSGLPVMPRVRRALCIGGGGDFAFSLLASRVFPGLEGLAACDNRPLAVATMDFKRALIRALPFDAAARLFGGRGGLRLGEALERARPFLSSESRAAFARGADDLQALLLDALRASGRWVAGSLRPRHGWVDYLPYLSSADAYGRLQRRLPLLDIRFESLEDALGGRAAGVDFAYLSNVLDDRTYCADPDRLLETAAEALGRGGALCLATQGRTAPMTAWMASHGLRLIRAEQGRFGFVSALQGHYAYSFLLFAKDGRG